MDAVPITDGKADKERAGLLKLVDDASALMAQGKTLDASVKLGNLQTKVDDLASAERHLGRDRVPHHGLTRGSGQGRPA